MEREDSPQPKNGGLPWGREGFVPFLPENQSCRMGETFVGLLQKRWSGLSSFLLGNWGLLGLVNKRPFVCGAVSMS